MLRFVIVLTAIMIHTTQAFAGGGDFVCTGKKGKRSVLLKGSYPGIMSLNSSQATLSVDGREVARFPRGTIKIKKFAKTVEAFNNHGEYVKGKVLSMTSGASRADTIWVPAYGIFLFNVPLECSVYE